MVILSGTHPRKSSLFFFYSSGCQRCQTVLFWSLDVTFTMIQILCPYFACFSIATQFQRISSIRLFESRPCLLSSFDAVWFRQRMVGMSLNLVCCIGWIFLNFPVMFESRKTITHRVFDRIWARPARSTHAISKFWDLPWMKMNWSFSHEQFDLGFRWFLCSPLINFIKGAFYNKLLNIVVR